MRKIVLREVSRSVQKAKVRLRGMEKVDEKTGKRQNYKYDDEPNPEEVTVATVTAEIAGYEADLEVYNQAKMTVAAMALELDRKEKKIAALSTQVLASGRGKFHNDSTLITLLGGTRKSDRKPPHRKAVEMKGDNNLEVSKTA